MAEPKPKKLTTNKRVSRPRLDYSGSNDLKSVKYMIDPRSTFRLIWDILVTFIICYTLIQIPIVLAWSINITLGTPWGIFTFITDIFLCIDIILNFRTAIFDKYDKFQIISDPKKVAKTYLTGWFTLDLITSIPFEFFTTGTETSIIKLFRLFRILKILRIFRLWSIFNALLLKIVSRDLLNFISLAKLMILMIFAAHFFSCLLYSVGESCIRHDTVPWCEKNWLTEYELENATIEEQYVTAIYWAIVTLYTTGYGDLSAQNPREMIVCMIVIVIGTCFFGYFIGAVSVVISEGDVVQSMRETKYQEAQAFVFQHGLNEKLTRALLDHNSYNYKQNNVFDDFDVLKSVPAYLQKEIGKFLCKKYLLDSIDIFNDIDYYCLGLISLELRKIQCIKDQYLYRINTLGHEMYIIRTGKALLMNNTPNKDNKIIQRGDVFGYECFVDERNYKFSVKTLSYCEFYALSWQTIPKILNAIYTERSNNKINSIRDRIQEIINDPNSDHCVVNSEYITNSNNKNDNCIKRFAKRNDSFNRNEEIMQNIDDDNNKYLHMETSFNPDNTSNNIDTNITNIDMNNTTSNNNVEMITLLDKK